MKRHSIFSAVAALVLLSMIVSVVYAYGTINAADGLIDPAWSATALRTDADDYADNMVDIVNGWFISDASTPTDLAFRIDTVGDIDQLNSTYFAVQIDCNNNTSGSLGMSHAIFG